MPLPLLPVKELDLTQVDRQGLVYRAQFLAQQVVPSWDDHSLNFPENVTLEGCAHLVAMAISVVNERLRQHALATMTSRLAAIRKGRVTGYTLSGATAAQVSGVVRLPNSVLATVQVPIAEGFRFQSGSNVWRLTAATTIDVGNNSSADVTLECAEEQQSVTLSDGTANQALQLDHEDIIEGSIEVSCGNGDYTNLNTDSQKLRSFAEVGPDYKGFIALLDNNGRAYVYFGNGINGAIPQGTITIDYKTGGGESARVEADADWDTLDGAYDADGNIKTVEFYNAAASVGGYDQTTVEEARVQIPQSVRTLERAVNEDDFEYAATRVAGIARAALLTSNHDATIGEDQARLYPIAYGSPYSDSGYYPPATPTTAQGLAVDAFIDLDDGEYAQMMGLNVTRYTPVFLDINVTAKIFKSANYTATQVKANITTALQKFFAIADGDRAINELINFGFKMLDANGDPDYKVAWSHVFNAVNDAEGVREVHPDVNCLLLNGGRSSIILAPEEFPRLGSITVYDMDSSGVEI
jgi:uncharacterized phage protein gp47/JayE